MGDDVRWLDQGEQKSWRGLVMGWTLLNDRLDADLRREFGLALAEYEILVRLSEHDGSLRMSQLAGAMAHSRSRITHTVTRMGKSGLVERTESREDGRGVVATLTEKGWELLRRAAPSHVTGVRENLLDVADPDDFEALGRVMNAVADHLIADHPGLDAC